MGIEVYYDGYSFSALSTVTMTTFAHGIKTPETVAKKIIEWQRPFESKAQEKMVYLKWVHLCTAIQNGKAADFRHVMGGKQVSWEEANASWGEYFK
jgi:hypothetical protein